MVSSGQTPSVSQTPQIVGRHSEQHQLDAALERARVGRGSLVWLAGEPGIGKSTLAEHLTAVAAERGFVTLWGTSWLGEGAPAFWPWLQALRQLTEQAANSSTLGKAFSHAFGDGAADLGPFAVELGFPPPTEATERFSAFDALTTGLFRLARTNPVLIVLDDVHWADVGTLEMLRFLARDLRAVSVIVLATYRDVEVDADHPLATLLGRIGSDPIHVQISPLGPSDVGELVRLTMGRDPGEEAAAAIAADAGGNPFFIRELSRLFDGRDTSRPLPSNLRQVVLDRVAALPRWIGEVLSAATVVGRSFAMDDLAIVTRRTREELLGGLHIAGSARLVFPDTSIDQHWSFVHAIVHEVLYAEMPAVARSRLHQCLAEEMDRSADRVPRFGERALHWSRAVAVAGSEPALAAAIAAADDALQRFAHEQAAAYLERALELQAQVAIDMPGGDANRRCTLLVALAKALVLVGDRPKIVATRTELVRWARIAGRPDMIALAGLVFGSPFVGWIADEEELELLEEALAGIPSDDSALRACVLARLCGRLVFSPDARRRTALGEEAVAMARRIGDVSSLQYALIEQVNVMWAGPDVERHLAMTNEAIALAEQSADRNIVLHARLTRLGLLMILGDGHALRVEMDAFERIATRARRPVYGRVGPLVRASLAFMEGRWTDAEALIAGAGREARRMSDVPAELGVMAATGALRQAQGRISDIADEIAAAAARFPQSMSMLAAHALGQAVSGHDDSAARIVAQIAANDFDAVPRDYLWSGTLFDTALAAVKIGDTAVAKAINELLLPCRELMVVTSRTGVAFRGPVAFVLGLTAELAGDLPGAAEHFQLAIAASERLGATICAADATWALARVIEQTDGHDARRVAELREFARRTADAVDVSLPLNGVEPPAHPYTPGTRAAAPADPNSRPAARRDHEVWTWVYEGVSTQIRHSVGLDHLARLVETPRVEHHALDLVAGWSGGARPSTQTEILDDAAKAAYRQRIVDLQAQLDLADADGDSTGSAGLQRELDAVMDELRRATGLGGRDRRLADDNERARAAVTKALRTSIRRITERDPSLGRHLDESIRTGTFCSYEADTAWTVTR